MRNRIAPALAVAGLLAAARVSAGCTASLSGAPCPCLDGFVCNEALNVCVDPRSVQDSSSDVDATTWDASGGVPDAATDFPDSGPCSDACPVDGSLGEPDADVGSADAG